MIDLTTEEALIFVALRALCLELHRQGGDTVHINYPAFHDKVAEVYLPLLDAAEIPLSRFSRTELGNRIRAVNIALARCLNRDEKLFHKMRFNAGMYYFSFFFMRETEKFVDILCAAERLAAEEAAKILVRAYMDPRFDLDRMLPIHEPRTNGNGRKITIRH